MPQPGQHLDMSRCWDVANFFRWWRICCTTSCIIVVSSYDNPTPDVRDVTRALRAHIWNYGTVYRHISEMLTYRTRRTVGSGGQ